MRSLLALAALGLASCTPKHQLDARRVGPLMLDVIEQHDESVRRDTELVPAEIEQALRGSAITREIIEEATR